MESLCMEIRKFVDWNGRKTYGIDINTVVGCQKICIVLK